MRERVGQVVADTAAAAAGIVGLMAIFAAAGLVSDRLAMAWMTSSFGASITLLLACPESPLGRPVTAMLGNVGSACIGVACQQLLGDYSAIAAPAAIIGAVAFMSITRSWHPPGGATAMLAVVGGPAIHRLGWVFPLCPILLGTVWLLALARVRGAWVRLTGEAATPILRLP